MKWDDPPMLAWMEGHPGLAAWVQAVVVGATILLTIYQSRVSLREAQQAARDARRANWRTELSALKQLRLSIGTLQTYTRVLAGETLPAEMQGADVFTLFAPKMFGPSMKSVDSVWDANAALLPFVNLRQSAGVITTLGQDIEKLIGNDQHGFPSMEVPLPVAADVKRKAKDLLVIIDAALRNIEEQEGAIAPA